MGRQSRSISDPVVGGPLIVYTVVRWWVPNPVTLDQCRRTWYVPNVMQNRPGRVVEAEGITLMYVWLMRSISLVALPVPHLYRYHSYRLPPTYTVYISYLSPRSLLSAFQPAGLACICMDVGPHTTVGMKIDFFIVSHRSIIYIHTYLTIMMAMPFGIYPCPTTLLAAASFQG